MLRKKTSKKPIFMIITLSYTVINTASHTAWDPAQIESITTESFSRSILPN